jgi:alpha-glucuronidase
MQITWRYKMRHYIDEQRWREVDERLQHQVENAREWRDTCLKYFGQFAKGESEYEKSIFAHAGVHGSNC